MTTSLSPDSSDQPPSPPAPAAPGRVVRAVSRTRAKPTLLQVLSRWLRQGVLPRENNSLRDAIEEAIEEHEDESDEVLPEEEKNILQNLLQFGDLTVRDVMVPRTDIVAVPENVTCDELKAVMVEHRHTRLPVYRESLDNILGFLHIKDMLPFLWDSARTFQAVDVMRQILVAPPSMKVVDLLVKMRVLGVHMAIVVDEYGGTDGLVTLENLFEEIVGEIQDEHDESEDVALQRIDATTVEADARVRLEKLESELGLDCSLAEQNSDYETVGGLVCSLATQVPLIGETFTHAATGLRFEVLAADPRAIKRVRVRMPGAAPSVPSQP